MMQLQPRADVALEQVPVDYASPDPNCICDRRLPLCAVCMVAIAAMLRREHPLTVSVAMLKRRIPGLLGREASLLLEATKLLPLDLEADTRAMLEAQPPAELPKPLKPEASLAPTGDREPPLVLMHSEARMLTLVRSKPGSTAKELAVAISRTPSYVGHTLRLLGIGGHARREGWRWYPTHDRPLGKVAPREKVSWKRIEEGE